MLTSRAHVCGVCEGHPPSALCPRPVTLPAAPSQCPIPPQTRRYLPHRTGGESGEQGPLWAGSMEELLGPGVSGAPDMPSLALGLHARARTGPLPRPASAEMASRGPAELRIGSAGAEAWHSWIHSAGNLRGKRGRGEVEEEREGRREGGRQRKGERWMRRDTARWTEWDRPRWLGDQQSKLPASPGCEGW